MAIEILVAPNLRISWMKIASYQAYYQWVYDKVPSLRQKIDPEGIKYLDVLLHYNNV